MKYDKRSVTDSGADLLAHSKAAGKRTVFGTIAITDTQVNKDPNTLVIDDLGNFLEFPIAYVKRPAAKTWQPGGVIGNTNINPGNHGSAFLTNVNNGTGTLNNPLSINTLGIIAHTEGEDNNTLFAAGIANPGEAIVVPNDTDIPYKLTLDFGIKIDNDVSNDDITIEVNNAGMVNFADLQEVLTNYIRINGDGTVTQSPDFQNSVKRRGVELVDQNQLNDALKNNTPYTVVDPNADVLQLTGPAVYKSVWGDQNTLKNFPGLDGSATIIVSTVNDSDKDFASGKKVTIIDSWGEIFENVWSNDHWNGWAKPITQDDITNAKNQLTSNINNLSADYNAFKKAAFVNQGQHNGDILDVLNSPDGYYQITGDTTNTPNGFDGYGVLIKYTAADTFVVLKNNLNEEWHNHYTNGKWDGWQRVATQKDLDTINGQLGGFKYQGVLDCNLLDVDKNNKADGYYQVYNDNGNVEGFSGYGILVIKRQGLSTYLTLASVEGVWRNTITNGNSSSWKQFLTRDNIASPLDPNADVLQLTGPAVYKSVWGYQNSLKNFPSLDGSATIIVATINGDSNDVSSGKKVIVIDSWGEVFENVWSNDHWNGWTRPATQDDTNSAYQNAVNTANSYTNSQLSSANNQIVLNSAQASVQAYNAFTSASSYASSYAVDQGAQALGVAQSYTDQRIGYSQSEDAFFNKKNIPLQVIGNALKNAQNDEFQIINISAYFNTDDNKIHIDGNYYYNFRQSTKWNGSLIRISMPQISCHSIVDAWMNNQIFYPVLADGSIFIRTTDGNYLGGSGYIDFNGIWVQLGQ